WSEWLFVRIAVDGAALGELVVAEAALVGARAAPQVLEAEVVGQEARGVDRADGRIDHVEQPAGHAGDRRREGVEGGGDPPDPAEGIRLAGVREVIEPPGELGAVGAEGGDLVERVAKRLRGGRQGAGAGGA